ncbi:hypothetical protein SDC9_45679 [bioreactor metagenome]|uniref:NAD-specific glutamate dehydrogenase n=1 Tax=bioreactor metagenome TaxID=1076179 RepID=A0A644W6V4_9ZZZZ
MGGAVGIGPEFLHFCGENDHFEKSFYALAGFGRDGADNGIAAPLLRHQLIFGELLLNALGIDVRFIHFVDGYDHRDVCGLGVVDGLDRLGHDTVVGGYHQNSYVGDHSAAGAHGGKRLVAWGIQEGNKFSIDLRLIGADMLRNAAGLAGRHIGGTDFIQQGRLAVVNVAHDHNHRRAGNQILLFVLGGVDQFFFYGDDDFVLHLAAQFHGD